MTYHTPHNVSKQSLSFKAHAFGLTLAIALSLIFHVILLTTFADYTLSKTLSATPPPTQKAYPQVEIDQLFRDPVLQEVFTPPAQQVPSIESVKQDTSHQINQELGDLLTKPQVPQAPNQQATTAQAPTPTLPDLPPLSPQAQDVTTGAPLQQVAAPPLYKLDNKPMHATLATAPASPLSIPLPSPHPPTTTGSISSALTTHLPSGPTFAPSAALAKGLTTPPLSTPPVDIPIAKRHHELTHTEPDLPVFQPLDKRLHLTLYTWQSPKDPAWTYFRLNISRKPTSTLPILPKDVIFVQDVSRSISYRRLNQCKKAIRSAMSTTLRIGDRFVIVGFRDKTVKSSKTFTPVTTESVNTAYQFLKDIRPIGTTDLFRGLSEVLDIPSSPERPRIIIVITDGDANTGIVETTQIINEFTRVNQGQTSVYTFSVADNDPYFLDMLSYNNRGEATTIQGDDWDISKELGQVFTAIRNPILDKITISFNAASGSEIYPTRLTNLYADKPLDIYGRCPRKTQEVVCQMRGLAGDNPYDAVFKFSLVESQVNPTLIDLRQAWAQRKLFDLLATYAANPSPTLLSQIKAHALRYQIKNPYDQD